MSTNGSATTPTWDNISGFANALTIGGGERAVGESYTADGDTPIVTTGKRGLYEVTGRVVYTEGTGDPFEKVRGAFENQTNLWLRWSPKGGSTGDFQFTTSAGLVTSMPFPGGDAGSADALITEFVLRCSTITKGTAT